MTASKCISNIDIISITTAVWDYMGVYRTETISSSVQILILILNTVIIILYQKSTIYIYNLCCLILDSINSIDFWYSIIIIIIVLRININIFNTV